MGNGRKCKRSIRLSESWGGWKNRNSASRNAEIKAAVRRNEAAWKEVLAARDEEAKGDVWKLTEKRRESLKDA